MSDLLPENLQSLLSMHWAQVGLRIILIVVIGLAITRLIALLVQRVTRRRFSPQTMMLARKAILYTGTFIVLVMVLQQLGLQITALLGAAGIIGIAVGFASQTSMSNLISGIFLISEKPFAVGDVIKVGDTTGIVLSVDLLSVKVRKFDNQFVRIPNQQILSTELTNITRFPIRRIDIKLGVAYKEDVKKVRSVLMDIATKNPYCLDEPAPLIIFTDFGDSALEFLFAVWVEKSDFLNLKNSIMDQIKERFDIEGIEIPFPHRTIYSGSITEPFPVNVVENSPKAKRRR
jgi:small-conductance mechanosensitive channel